MNKYKNTLLIATALVVVSTSMAEAGIVTITNHSQSELNINVIAAPDGAPYCKKCLGSPLRACESETATILIPLDALFGWPYFALLDVTHGILGGSQCTNLSVYKNYDVSFYETTLGTRCQCTEKVS